MKKWNGTERFFALAMVVIFVSVSLFFAHEILSYSSSGKNTSSLVHQVYQDYWNEHGPKI